MPDPGAREIGTAPVAGQIVTILASSTGYPADPGSERATYIGRDGAGLPIYRVSYTSGGRQIVRTVTYDGRHVAAPDMRERVPEPDGGTQHGDSSSMPVDLTTHDARLQELKDGALSWIAKNGNWMSQDQIDSWTKRINDYSGSVAGFQQLYRTMTAEVGAIGRSLGEEEQGGGELLLGGGGGGGGGGYAGPTYVAPDRRVVEDFVKGSLISLVGHIPSDRVVARLTDLYMKDHRADFDTLDRKIDPQQSVVEAIRATREYGSIHRLRPDSEDERTWVANRRASAVRGGLRGGLQEEFAIQQALIGADPDDAVSAAARQQVSVSGTTRGTPLQDTVRNAAKMLMQGVRR